MRALHTDLCPTCGDMIRVLSIVSDRRQGGYKFVLGVECCLTGVVFAESRRNRGERELTFEIFKQIDWRRDQHCTELTVEVC